MKKLLMALAATVICGASLLTSCSKEEPAANSTEPERKVLLVILDGWGIGDQGVADAIAQTPTPYIDYLNATYPHSILQASGEAVGLPAGQMGNSETGHLNIGAGRVVYQDLMRINRACADNSILDNPEIQAAYTYAQTTGHSLHLMGLTSDGGVHSSIDHLKKLIDIAAQYGISNCYVHCFMDGRDTDPMAGKGFIIDLQQHMQTAGTGVVATAIGRYYAMDRDQHWDRIRLAYDLLVNGQGRAVTDMVAGVQSCYDSHTETHKNTDEFMEPLVNSTVDGRIQPGDVVIFFNFRSDRAKEITIALTQRDISEEGLHTIPNLQYYCMTPYDDSFTGVHVIFPKENLTNTLGEYLSGLGLRQLHIAETEKYAHVTSFINGGREEPFPSEDRILVNSPAVATYDLQPEMSAYEVKDRLIEALRTGSYHWVVVNFANADMVGHTGVYSAIATAVQTIDQCLSEVVEAAKAMGYDVVITADHGNADHALNADGTPNTTHSTNPVPLIYVTSTPGATVQNGVLSDVAPSILRIMGLSQPQEMTGRCLISK